MESNTHTPKFRIRSEEKRDKINAWERGQIGKRGAEEMEGAVMRGSYFFPLEKFYFRGKILTAPFQMPSS